MEIRIHAMSQLSTSEQEKIKRALKSAEPVLDSINWESKMLRASFKESKGYSNQQIINMIRSGSHDGGSADQVIDINMIGFYKLNNIVGYTYLGSLKQWINRHYLNKYDFADIFHHVMHETMHRSFRFKHSTARAQSSVPYLVGFISADAHREFYKNLQGFTDMKTNLKVFTFLP